MPDHGQMQLYDNFIPALSSGDYSVEVSQRLLQTNSKDNTAIDRTLPPATQRFTVRAPRFSIEKTDVVALYPPAGSRGAFGATLPHIVLNKRALPWERRLGLADRQIPWLALLLFSESELIDPGQGSAAAQGANPTRLFHATPQDIAHPGPGYVAPDLALDDDDDPAAACTAIECNVDVFSRVAPRLLDLRYLAHCRQIPAKPGTEDPASGWHSVIVGNRFPFPAGTGSDTLGPLNIVHLVSLEGFQNYLVDTPAWPQGAIRLRLVSLVSWSYVCLPQKGESFKELMEHLVAPEDLRTTRLRLLLPTDTPPPGTQPVADRLAAGYVAKSYWTRQGEKTFAWIRSPLAPQPVPRFDAWGPFYTASAAAVYLPDTGCFDLSYAAAWQAARLLALSDRSFARDLLQWRRNLRQALARTIAARTFADVGVGAPPAVGPAAQAVALLQQRLGVDLTTPREPQPTHERISAVPRRDAFAPVERIRRCLADAGPLNNDDVDAGLEARIAKWLAGLWRLEGLPFDVLVPDARMLPPGSIRFFYVDRNVLDAMFDGALSICIHSGLDRAVQAARRPALGVNVVEQPQAPVAGFLLRSPVVSGWPGLRVNVYSDAEKKSPIVPMRVARLGSDVLICLLPAVPSVITLGEPHEGLRFGMLDDGIHLRRVDGQTGTLVGGQPLPARMRNGSRVLQVQALADDMRNALKQPIGPAGFAVQMIEAPEEMEFSAPPPPKAAHD